MGLTSQSLQKLGTHASFYETKSVKIIVVFVITLSSKALVTMKKSP
jgi:hypothetical protein